MTKLTINIICILLIQYCVFGQSDPILFTVNDKDVNLSEFEYIYSKNNADKAAYSEESLREYLDLYIKFKLKVEEGRLKRIDTLPSYIEELAGYRRQLADSYIMEKELARRIAKEAYKRMQKDISFSHILVNLNAKAPPTKINEAREKIEKAYAELNKGQDFGSLAKKYSEDKKTKDKGGKVGFLTAILPDGYYALESALYNTPKGSNSNIIRTNLGFHIVRVDKIRKARGRITVAHLLIRKKFKGIENPDAGSQIEKIYKDLKNGASFELLVIEKSQDNNTKLNGGNLGEFGIGKYEKLFEDAAFSLKKDGDISKPIESSIGFHIIKRIRKNDLGTYEEIVDGLIKRTNKGDRQKAGKELLKNEVKKEAGYICYDPVLNLFIGGLDETFYQYNWSVPSLSNSVLCKLGSQEYSISDFANYSKKQGRLRMQYSNSTPYSEAVQELYDSFISEKTIDYQQNRLEEKYIDFRNLMREYEEGILLFEITKEVVWDKASQDKDGIKHYYENHRENYVWNERAEVTNYSIRSTDIDLINKILRKATNQDPEKVAKTFNENIGSPKVVMFSNEIYEKDQEELKGLQWKQGAVTAPKINNALKMSSFTKIQKIIPESQKSLDDARGFVISDYQLQLEKEWIDELREKYKVEINNNALMQLIKK